MPSKHFHIERLRELLQREIGTVISQELRSQDPACGYSYSGETCSGYRNATIYVSVLGDQNEKTMLLLPSTRQPLLSREQLPVVLP